MGYPDTGFLFYAVLVVLILSSYALICAHVTTSVQDLSWLLWLFVQHKVNGDWHHHLNWFPSVLVCLWARSPLTWHLPASE